MSREQPVSVDYVDWPNLLQNPPLSTSFQLGWSGIQLAHYCQPSISLPEVSNPWHIIIIPICHQTFELEIVLEKHLQVVSYREEDYISGCIEIIPGDMSFGVHSISGQVINWIQCYIEPAFLAQIAHESVHPNHVELLLTPKKADPLIHQIGLALKSSLEIDEVSGRFYADSMATALSAHLLRHYSTHNHHFHEYKNGLSKQKLRQVTDYIQTHLSEDLSLSEIADEVGISQYYFCRLFKKSTGLSPHKYLIIQRVEHAKQLLKHLDKTITFIALECGFANQSHFAKCFRQHTGISPKDFRSL